MDFLLNSRCACSHGEWKGILAGTASALLLPAFLLLTCETLERRVLGFLTLLLVLTSLLYHLSHSPLFRAPDVCACISVSLLATWIVVSEMVTTFWQWKTKEAKSKKSGKQGMRLAAAFGLLGVVSVSYLPFFQSKKGETKLGWHVGMHVLAVVSLCLVAETEEKEEREEKEESGDTETEEKYADTENRKKEGGE